MDKEQDIKLYTPYKPENGNTDINQDMSKNELTYYTWKYMISNEHHSKIWNQFIEDDMFSYCSNFLGWQKEAEYKKSGYAVQVTYHGYNESFDKLYQKSLINKRPMILIYGGYRNYGTMIYNYVQASFGRSFAPSYSSLRKYYPYIMYYIDDGTNEQANKVKDFITQYGEITTGYPWYMVYGYKEDGSLYVRYGSLYTQSMIGQVTINYGTTYIGGKKLESLSIYERDFYIFRDCLKEIGEYQVPVEEVRYQVVFQDYDGTVLDSQSVKEGNNAIPPEDPTREGYLFTGWSPSCENVQSNLTIIAQYIVNKNSNPQPKQDQEEQVDYSKLTTTVIPIEKFGPETTKHTYSDYKEHKMRISSNVVRINVYSDQEI